MKLGKLSNDFFHFFFIDVPISGIYKTHAGYQASTHAIVTLDGKEVYRREIGKEPVQEKVTLEQGKRYPVTITYPATVIGPDDPGLTEAHVGMLGYLKAFVPVMPTGNQYVDVRDVAGIHRRLLELRPPAGR